MLRTEVSVAAFRNSSYRLKLGARYLDFLDDKSGISFVSVQIGRGQHELC